MKKVFWLVLMVTVYVSTAFADGDSRKATAEEKEYTLRVLKVFESAVQKGPDGWDTADKTNIRAPEYVTAGQEDYPMGVHYFIKWEDGAKIRASESAIEGQLGAMAEKMKPEEQMKANMAEYERLAEEFGKALENKDMQKAESLRNKMDEVGRKLNEQADQKEDAFNQQIRDMTPHDVDLRVNLTTNVFDQSFAQIPSEQGVIDGCRIIRIDDEGYIGEGWHEGNTYIFAGDFEYVDEDSYASVRAEADSDIPHTRVQTVMIHITGDRNRVKDFIRKIDLKSIRGLLGS